MSVESESAPHIFYVEMRGVYGQGVRGIFADFESAKQCALACAKKEFDDYHRFHVFKTVLNKIDPEDELVFETSKRRAERL